MSLTGLGFTKTALTKMVKMVQQGKLSAEAAGEASKKLNLKSRELKFLGEGGESVATLVTDPTHGLAVQKYKNPQISIRQYARKNVIARRLNKSNSFAKYYGRNKNSFVTKHEYIKGEFSKLDKGFPDKLNLEASNYIKDVKISDIGGPNVINNKVIDYHANFIGGKNSWDAPKHLTDNSARIEAEASKRFPNYDKWQSNPFKGKKYYKEQDRQLKVRRNRIKFMASAPKGSQ